MCLSERRQSARHDERLLGRQGQTAVDEDGASSMVCTNGLNRRRFTLFCNEQPRATGARRTWAAHLDDSGSDIWREFSLDSLQTDETRQDTCSSCGD